MIKPVKPGDKRHISFPLDVDMELLGFLNKQNNFSAAIISLARTGLEYKYLFSQFEKRLSFLEDQFKNQKFGTAYEEINENQVMTFNPDNEEDEYD